LDAGTIVRKKLLVILAIFIALACAAAYYAYVPGRVPNGQAPVARLDPTAFESQFRAASNETRLLVMLSPT